MSDYEWIREQPIGDGWKSVVMYQPFAPDRNFSPRVATYDNKKHRFVGVITVCTGNIWHAHRYFEALMKRH